MAFNSAYAQRYDQLYLSKDYAGECAMLERIFQQHGNIQTVLDLGCGTGNHAIPLAQKGYTLTGVDASAEMLREAESKAAGMDIQWVRGDLAEVDLKGSFDAAICMFAVLGYFNTNDQVMAALKNIRRHLRKGGLLVFDCWYGPAVLTIRPSDRVKVIPSHGGQVIRMVQSCLDSRRHLCEVRYHLWHLEGERLVAETEELHLVRYFFPLELELMLSQSGFSLSSLTAFPSIDTPVDEATWNALGIACAG
jgi:SAM-dependent methyltransferase